MRAKIAKRIKRNIMNSKPNQKLLVEVHNYYGDNTKTFISPKKVYKAAKEVYKYFRKNGQHKKANSFLEDN